MFWIIVAAVIIMAGILMVYWTLLNAMYPEQLRTTEIYTVTTDDIWKLRICRYRQGRSEGEPVLLVHGFNSNQHNFTEPEGACLVDYLVEQGYDCWCIDLRGCRSCTPAFERTIYNVVMEDYLDRDLPAAVKLIRETTCYNRIHWIGHSMGGSLLYAYVQKYGSEHIASGVTLGSPLGFEKAKARVPWIHIFFGSHFPYAVGGFLRAMVPPAMWLPLFSSMFPANKRNLHRKTGVGHIINMLDVPPPVVLKEISSFMNSRKWAMYDGGMNVAEGFSSMKLPLLAFCAKRDPFMDIDSVRERIESMPGKDAKIIVLSKEEGCVEDYNHVDMVMSREGEKEVFEPVCQWLRKHSSGERLNLYENAEENGDMPYMAPLEESERAKILSGHSYSHVTSRADDPEMEKAEEADTLLKPTIDLTERQKILSGHSYAHLTTEIEEVEVDEDAGMEREEEAQPEKPTEPEKKSTKKKSSTKKKKTVTKKKSAAKKKKPAVKKKSTTKKKSSSGKKKAAPEKSRDTDVGA